MLNKKTNLSADDGSQLARFDVFKATDKEGVDKGVRNNSEIKQTCRGYIL